MKWLWDCEMKDEVNPWQLPGLNDEEVGRLLEDKRRTEQDNVRDRSENCRRKSRSRSRDRSIERSSRSSHREKSEDRKFRRTSFVITEKFRELESSQDSSENNHAKLYFNNFFLYSARQRPELSASPPDSEKFDRILVEMEISRSTGQNWSNDESEAGRKLKFWCCGGVLHLGQNQASVLSSIFSF